MSSADVFVDAEGAVKTWLKTVTAVSSIVGERVFLGVNERSDSLPQVVVNTVAGGPDLGESALSYPRIQIDAWAASRRAAEQLGRAIGNACWQLSGTPTSMGDDAVCLGARVLTVPRFPASETDELAGRYRYTLDVEFALRAA